MADEENDGSNTYFHRTSDAKVEFSKTKEGNPMVKLHFKNREGFECECHYTPSTNYWVLYVGEDLLIDIEKGFAKSYKNVAVQNSLLKGSTLPPWLIASSFRKSFMAYLTSNGFISL